MKYGVSLPGLMSTTMMFLSSTVTLKMSGEIMGLHEDEMESAMESMVLNRTSSGMPMMDLSSPTPKNMRPPAPLLKATTVLRYFLSKD